MYLVGNTVEFFRKVLDRSPHKENVRQTTLRRLPRRLHRRFFERFCVRVDADEKLVRVCSGRCGHKATVPGPDVDHYPFAGTGQ